MSVIYVLIARIPVADVPSFRAYEEVVLPLLPEHGGRLDRRMQSADGTLEVHLLEFETEDALATFRADARRVAATRLLGSAQPELELVRMVDVTPNA